MTLQIIDCEQRSPEWFEARMGIPTASEFKAILSKGRGSEPSKTRLSYMRRLCAETITGLPGETFESQAMIRGREMEDQARSYYAFMQEAEPELVGFVRNGQKGCSPDSFLGDAGMLEIKTQRADLLVDTILKDQFPPEHKAQCQGQLWVAERQWLDLVVYWPNMPLFVKRVERDEKYIAELAGAVTQFNNELAGMVGKIRQYEAA